MLILKNTGTFMTNVTSVTVYGRCRNGAPVTTVLMTALVLFDPNRTALTTELNVTSRFMPETALLMLEAKSLNVPLNGMFVYMVTMNELVSRDRNGRIPYVVTRRMTMVTLTTVVVTRPTNFFRSAEPSP